MKTAIQKIEELGAQKLCALSELIPAIQFSPLEPATFGDDKLPVLVLCGKWYCM